MAGVTTENPFRSGYRGVPPGTRLNGIYEIDKLIAAGGMGEIYKSHEIQTGAAIAIKMLLPEMADNEAALELFRREASALHHLPHDAIVRYFLFTVEPVLQRPYLAMEFVDGRSLSDVLDEGPLPLDTLAALIRRVASALHVAHSRGIIHRDVSPDNIILPDGDLRRAKVIDFGIARYSKGNDPTIIGSGFAGKHNYVSPEQVGLFGHEVTFKSDIYSLGLVLVHAATGTKLDMGGSQFQIVEKRRRVPDLSAVDARIRPLLERMLQPDPADRPASMEEIANWALPQAATNTIGIDRPAAAATGSRQGWRGAPLALAAGVLLLGSALFASYYYFGREGGAGAPAATRLNEPPKLSPAQPPPTTAARIENPPSAVQTPSPLVPSTPAPPAASAAPTMSRADRVRAYIDKYDGGDCFLVVPVAISQTAAIVEAFGAQADIDRFGRAFRSEQGFDASTGARQVTPAQCPAVRFLSRLRNSRIRPVRIDLSSVEIKSGELLTGTIENVGNRHVELLLITDGGLVQNMSTLMKPALDSFSFSIGIKRNEPSAAPELLMAVSTPQPVPALRPPQAMMAETFFAQSFGDSRDPDAGVAAVVRYFRLSGP